MPQTLLQMFGRIYSFILRIIILEIYYYLSEKGGMETFRGLATAQIFQIREIFQILRRGKPQTRCVSQEPNFFTP